MSHSKTNFVKQIGGEHYASEYPHWDWVEDVGMGYLEGCATKYLVRWRDRGGVEDLHKAYSYIEKVQMRHSFLKNQRTNRRDLPIIEATKLTHEFVESNRMDSVEGMICYRLVTWRTVSDLKDAMEAILTIVDRAVAEETSDAATGPGTPEDGGHHARQPTPEIDD